MKGIDWGLLYNKHKNDKLDANKLERAIKILMMDDDVTNKKGIYSYILTHDEKYLNIRAFTENQKRAAYEKQKGVCRKCKKSFEYDEMEVDHIKPWSEVGKTSPDNLQMICKYCNRRKGKK
jgi:vacuolar-type H+-ATPase catalytic subunit A/Vma1